MLLKSGTMNYMISTDKTVVQAAPNVGGRDFNELL